MSSLFSIVKSVYLIASNELKNLFSSNDPLNEYIEDNNFDVVKFMIDELHHPITQDHLARAITTCDLNIVTLLCDNVEYVDHSIIHKKIANCKNVEVLEWFIETQACFICSCYLLSIEGMQNTILRSLIKNKFIIKVAESHCEEKSEYLCCFKDICESFIDSDLFDDYLKEYFSDESLCDECSPYCDDSDWSDE